MVKSHLGPKSFFGQILLSWKKRGIPMWELLLEFDYQTVRHAVWAGYLFTFVFPLAAFYFLNKKAITLE
ncbi:hypothetical protein RCO48_30135 [Peribacillus frigoritolerans]|nr:hypothetical protein [Peribacillus frigoritolerans]